MTDQGINTSMPTAGTTAPSIQIQRHFAAPPTRVFDVFAGDITSWWPGHYKLGAADLREVVIEPFEGGRWFERSADGSECDWGRVLIWDPPHRLVLSWQIGPGFTAEPDPERASRLELRFDSDDNGGTHLALVHEQLDNHGTGWDVMRDALVGSGGWAWLISRLAAFEAGQVPEYGSVPARGAIRFERLLPGPIERVWDFLVDSEKRGRWLATGVMPTAIGTPFKLRFMHDDLSPEQAPLPEKYAEFADGCDLDCSLTAYDPPHEIAYRWEGASEVRFRLKAEGNQVRLTLIHTQLDESEMISVASGWHTHLGILVDVLDDRVPRPFWREHLRLEDDYRERLGAVART
jgi:uncharacterized protein YndB with AHSA1/START domain